MNRLAIACIAAAILSTNVHADEKQDAARKVADVIVAAIVKGDFAKVFDHTYPPIVKELGGREKAIEQTEAVMKQGGFSINEVKFGAPGDYLTEGKLGFVVLPTTITMTIPQGTIVADSYLLGISEDDGKTWTFADGAGIKDPKAREKVLPKLPEKLKLPEPGEPKFTPKK